VAKLRALEAEKRNAKELIDASSARTLLERLRAHDGPSALQSLEAVESKGREYRKILGRFQQQMTDFSAGGVHAPRSTAQRQVEAGRAPVWKGASGGTVRAPVGTAGAPRQGPPRPMTSRGGGSSSAHGSARSPTRAQHGGGSKQPAEL
jgi:hypothetical protein